MKELIAVMRGYGGYGGGYGYGDMMGGGWFGGLLMAFFGLLILVGIVMLVIWAVRAASGGHGHMMAGGHPGAGGAVPPAVGQAGHHEAVAIAKRRLASGEITPEQYKEIMEHLAS